MSRAPFPTDALPGAVRRFIEAEAEALGCDASMVALPALAALAGAVGSTRCVEVRPGWEELPIVWACVVAPSGTHKSPAMTAALAPLEAWQGERLREHEAAEREYAQAAAMHERELSAWRKRADGSDPPVAPVRPEAERIIVSDVTLEALAPILRANPRGVLVARDELAGWVRGFDAYRAGGRGGDCATWLGCNQGKPLTVDRKSGDVRTIHVPRAVVSVIGTMQPGVFERTLTGEHLANGLTARLLVARPDVRPRVWRNASTPPDVRSAYEATVRRLLTLTHAHDPEGGPCPVQLALTAEARDVFKAWFNANGARMDGGTDELRAALSKIEAYAARFALLFQLVRDPDAGTVDVEAVRAGCAMADWFAAEAERLYATIGESDAERERRLLVEWIMAPPRNGETTERELRNGRNAYKASGVAKRALDELAAANVGFWVFTQPDGGGRPSERFRLWEMVMRGDGSESADSTITYETPCGDALAGVSSVSVVSVGASTPRHGATAPRALSVPPAPALSVEEVDDALRGARPIRRKPPRETHTDENNS